MKRISGLSFGVLALLSSGRAELVDRLALANEIDSLRNAVSQLENRLAQGSEHTSIPSASQGAGKPAGDSIYTPPPKEVATKDDVDGLRADLENYKYENQRNRETKTALVTRGTTIGGTIQARGSAVSPGTTAGTTAVAAPRGSSYDIPSASINFGGSLYRDYTEGRNLDFRVQLAYGKNAPANDNSLFNLGDAYIRYSPLSTVGLEDWKLNATIGQQLLPFGLEAQTGEELRPVINSAQFLAGTGIGKRQVGLVIRGDIFPYVDYGFNYRAPLFEYNLGIVTGSGPNKSDDNDAKDFILRGSATLPVDYHSVFRELKVGASYYQGKKVITRNVSTTTGTGTAAVTTTSTVVADDKAKQVRLGTDLYYNHDPFGVTYEYAQGKDGAWIAAKAKTATQAAVPAHEAEIQGEGHVVTAFFTFGNQWVRAIRGKAKYDDWWPSSYQLFARYDIWDPNTGAGNDDSKVYTAGFNWFFAETTKFQLNYNLYKYQDPAKHRAKELLAQVQFGF
jgi:phosphate-selective porin